MISKYSHARLIFVCLLCIYCLFLLLVRVVMCLFVYILNYWNLAYHPVNGKHWDPMIEDPMISKYFHARLLFVYLFFIVNKH